MLTKWQISHFPIILVIVVSSKHSLETIYIDCQMLQLKQISNTIRKIRTKITYLECYLFQDYRLQLKTISIKYYKQNVLQNISCVIIMMILKMLLIMMMNPLLMKMPQNVWNENIALIHNMVKVKKEKERNLIKVWKRKKVLISHVLSLSVEKESIELNRICFNYF